MRNNPYARVAVSGFLLASMSCSGSADKQEQKPELESISLTLFTPRVELFMEHPPLIRGENTKFVAHFTVLSTGEPIRAGSVTFEGVFDNGKRVSFKAEKPARDGLFTPIHTFEAAGKIRARFVIDSPQINETVDMGEFIVHDTHAEALAAAQACAPEPDPSGTVPFLMEQQWKISMLVDSVIERHMVERLRCPGKIVSPIDCEAEIHAPISGRLLAPPGGALPRLGTAVQAGDLLAMVEPTTPILNETATYAIELRTRAVAIQRDIDDALAQIHFAKREHDRLINLQKQDVSSPREIYMVERDLALAESQHAAALAMKAKYDEAANQLELLHEAARKPRTDSSPPDPLRMRLLAPIAGVVISATHTVGEQLNVEAEIFRVADRSRVWVETRISEFDLAKLPEKRNALIVPSAFPDQRIDVNTGGGREVFLGTTVDSKSRTVTLLFEIPNANGVLRDGMLTDVFLETSRHEKAIAIPESAIVHDNGIPVAFVLLDGERCRQRELELGIRDNGFVEVKKGLSIGERVVTRGAYAVKLASKSAASFGHGHVH